MAMNLSTNMEKQEKIFIDGMRFELPSDIMKEKTPWIKGKISVKVPDFINFANKHQTSGGWINIDLKKSGTSGKLYLELNVYNKPKPIEEDHSAIDPLTGRDLNPINPEDIPF